MNPCGLCHPRVLVLSVSGEISIDTRPPRHEYLKTLVVRCFFSSFVKMSAVSLSVGRIRKYSLVPYLDRCPEFHGTYKVIGLYRNNQHILNFEIVNTLYVHLNYQSVGHCTNFFI